MASNNYIITAFLIALGYFLGKKGSGIVQKTMPFISNKAYWAVYILLSLIYFIGELFQELLPESITKILIIVGIYWLSALMYLSIIILFLILLGFINKRLSIISRVRSSNSLGKYKYIIAITTVVAILIYGTINSKILRDTDYYITINKASVPIKSLNAVFISDVHLGEIIDRGRLEEIISKINLKKPDIIFITGDILDGSLLPYINNHMGDTLRGLKSKYGVYASLGNHEYKNENIEAVIGEYNKANIKVLRDGYDKINDSFYIVGRDDLSKNRFGKRKDLNEVLKYADKSLPIIVMDHQPTGLTEAFKAHVDLLLSGHTHGGQIFPINMLANIIYELPYGYMEKGNTKFIVSSGAGTCGPPLRIGSYGEIVNLHITFENK